MRPCLKTNKHFPPKLNINSSQSHSFCDLIPSDGFTAVSGHPDDVLHTVISGWDVLGSLHLWTSRSWDAGALPARVHLTYCDYHQQQRNIKTSLLPSHLVNTTPFIFLGEVLQTDSNKSIKNGKLKPPTTKCDILEPARARQKPPITKCDTLEPATARHTFPWITLKDLCKKLLSLMQLITDILLYAKSTFYITYDGNEIKYLSRWVGCLW